MRRSFLAVKERAFALNFCVPLGSMHFEQSACDDTLVARLCQNDSLAFEELYCIYGRRVYSTIYRIVRSHVVAEDLSQEVFIKVWSRPNDFECGTSRSLAAWLVAVARNRSIDYLRSTEGRMTRASREIPKIETNGCADDAEARIARNRQVARLEAAVGNLDEDHRRVVGLIYFEGLTHVETANHQSRPLGTIKSWVRQALITLRQDLVEVN